MERIERCCGSRCCVAKSGALLGIAPRQSDVQTGPSNWVVAESCCCAATSLHAFKSLGEKSSLGALTMSILSILLFLLSWAVFAMLSCSPSLVAAATYRWWMPAMNWSLRIQTVLAGSALASIKFDSEADEIAASLVFICFHVFTISQREFELQSS